MDAPVKPRGRPKDEQLTARRTEEILDVAARLFAGRGYRNTDVQVVADELRVGKGTVYRYFPTKRELFLAAVDRGMQRLTQFIDASMVAEDPAEQLEQAIRAYLRFFEANPEFVELLIQERAEFKDRPKPTYFGYRDANLPKWEALVRQLIATGRVREMRLDTITNVVGDLVYGTMFTNYFSGRHRPLDEQADDILEVVLMGLLTDAERNRLRGGAANAPARTES
jgi:AcrR family transcriptional regulator